MSADIQGGTAALPQFRGVVPRTTTRPVAKKSEAERLARAKEMIRREVDGAHATYLEACIHCGMCADACHFYVATGEAQYSPVLKLAPLKRVYDRELGPLRWLYKLVTKDVTLQELEEWQPLVYDSCTECGRCDLMCPMGIQISPMIGIMRRALAEADLLPAEIAAVAEEQKRDGTVFGVGQADVVALAQQLTGRGVNVPLDKDHATVVLLTSALDVKGFPGALEATAKILNRMGVDWTLLSRSLELIGTGESLRELNVQRLIDEVVRREAAVAILPECGHAYPALRFDAAHMLGEPLSFEVYSISEYLGKAVQEGRLKLKQVAREKITYHDPCKIGRHGGVFDEPRAAIKALGLELSEMDSHDRTNYCCGGGGGQFLIERAQRLRQRAFEIKMREVDDSGAQAVLTACSSCRLNYMNGSANANWKTPVRSLVEVVAANLE